MAFDREWDESVPSGASLVRAGDDAIRDFKYAIRERLAVDHNFHQDESGEENIGAHDQVTLLTRTAPPLLADAIRLYGKDADGKCELYVKNEDGTEVRWSYLGYILGDSIRLTNNTYLKAMNASGTGTVDLIKANSSNKAVLPDGAELASDSPPTTDAGIVNKKYHDDDVASRFDTSAGHDHDGTDSKKLDSTGMSGVLGAWETKSNNTVYQAQTDGFVIGYSVETGNALTYSIGYTDSDNPPSTIRWYDEKGRSGDTFNFFRSVVCMPVRKGEYWKVYFNQSSTIYWIPLGT